jgi:hypothetical protein
VRVEFTTRSRGYVLTLERDLFGAFILYRRWYGLHNRRGGIKRQIFLDQDSALREFQRVERTRAGAGMFPYRISRQLHRIHRPCSAAPGFSGGRLTSSSLPPRRLEVL